LTGISRALKTGKGKKGRKGRSKARKGGGEKFKAAGREWKAFFLAGRMNPRRRFGVTPRSGRALG